MTITILAAAEDWDLASAPTDNLTLVAWVRQIARLTQPERIVWCDGSQEEWERLTAEMVAARAPSLRSTRRSGRQLPRPFRAERRRAGREPHLHRVPPARGRRPDQSLARTAGPARGAGVGVPGLHARPEMYVVPFAMGPARRPVRPVRRRAHRLALRRREHAHHDPDGREILARITEDTPFVPAVHSVGYPLVDDRDGLPPGRALAVQRAEVHRPLPRDPRDLVVRVRLRRKCPAGQEVHGAAHRLGRCPGRGLAGRAHAAGTGHSPAGRRYHVAAAFPSACGKTNFAMLQPTLPGWRVETIGDDIAWMRPGPDGRLRAVNPEAGFFGVAPGTGRGDQRQRRRDHRRQHHLHQRRADRRTATSGGRA